jgi:hypothetical protein
MLEIQENKTKKNTNYILHKILCNKSYLGKLNMESILIYVTWGSGQRAKNLSAIDHSGHCSINSLIRQRFP